MSEHCSPELIAEIVDAFNQKDFDAIANFFAEDGVFRTARGPSPGALSIVGPEAIKEYLAARHAQFPDWQWISSRNWCAGEYAVAEWTVSGTEPSGGKFEWLGCDIFVFEHGKIKLKDTYWKSEA